MDPLTITALALTAGVTASLVGLHLSPIVVPRVGRWAACPVVVCKRSAHDEVAEAIMFWEDRGFIFGPLEVWVPSVVPNIQIAFTTAPKPSDGTGLGPAETRGRSEVDLSVPDDHKGPDIVRQGGVIVGARITIDSYLSKEDRRKTLIHELGHALGFGHAETAVLGRGRKGGARMGLVAHPKGHVMHPDLSEWGPSTKGMEVSS